MGGTNPSLLRAIGAGTATFAWDVVFNREVLGDEAGRYFSAPQQLPALLARAESDPDWADGLAAAVGRRAAAYDWDDVADRYELLCRRLVARSRTRSTGTPPDGPSSKVEVSA